MASLAEHHDFMDPNQLDQGLTVLVRSALNSGIPPSQVYTVLGLHQMNILMLINETKMRAQQEEKNMIIKPDGN